MRRWSPASLPLRWKLQLAFLGVGLLAVFITGLLTYSNARSALERVTTDRLTAIRDSKKRQVETSFRTLRELCRILATHPDLLAVPQKGRETSASRAILDDVRQRFGLDDIIVVDRNGLVLESVRSRDIHGIAIRLWNHGGAPVETLVRSAISLPRDSVLITDFSVPPDGTAPTALLALPLKEGDVSLGVLLVRLSIDGINRIMTSDANWKSEGLGESGETYIVGSDSTMRTDSRFFVQNRDLFFRRLRAAGTDSAVLGAMMRRGSSILLQKVSTEAAGRALQGESFVGFVRDYRQVEVISASAPLDLPGLRWAILAEIDTDEAFAAVYAFREHLLLGVLVILGIAGIFSVAVARTVARPLLQLIDAAHQFGDQGGRIPEVAVASRDEIGLLARTFNAMVENIASHTARLEREVAMRTETEAELRRSEDRLRSLSAHLQSAREEERKALAREIHDELGQSLSALKLNLGVLRDALAPSAERNAFTELLTLLDTTIKSVRRLITDLRPHLLDDLGLGAALEWLVDEFGRRTGIRAALHLPPDVDDLDAERAISVFRIVQEALTNVTRHAQAREVDIRLERSDRVLDLWIHDNGIGLDPARGQDPQAFGLLGMRERVLYWGGDLDVQGSPGVGTTIHARITLSGATHDSRDHHR